MLNKKAGTVVAKRKIEPVAQAEADDAEVLEVDPEELEHQLEGRREIINLLAAELNMQRQSYASRASSINSRLGILIAAASLVTGLQAATSSPGVAYVVGACLAAAAALTGVFGYWPWRGGENGVQALQDELWYLGPNHAAYRLLHRQLDVLKDDEKLLGRKARIVQIGFGLLALSIGAAAFHAIQLSMLGEAVVQPDPTATTGTP